MPSRPEGSDVPHHEDSSVIAEEQGMIASCGDLNVPWLELSSLRAHPCACRLATRLSSISRNCSQQNQQSASGSRGCKMPSAQQEKA